MEPLTTDGKSPTASFPPLQDPGKQIRLLQIEPTDNFDDDVHCSLRQYNLEDTPDFNAISYTWGPECPQRHIFIGNLPFPVRENCHYAIQQARWYLRNGPALIWIDSVCIKQECLEEKSAQVRIMGEIYAQAVAILACIGPSDESSNFVAEVLEDVDRWVADLPSEYGEGFEEQMAEAWKSPVHNDSETIDLRHHCAQFSSRPYFHRVWVVQELFEGRGRTRILCGQIIIDWDRLVDLMWRMDLIIDRGGFGDEEPPWNNLLQIHHQITAPSKSHCLGPILAMSKQLLCTDPRDRVFAVLRLVNWQRSGLPAPIPDYNQSRLELALALTQNGYMQHLDQISSLAEALQLTCEDLDGGEYLFTPEHDDPIPWPVGVAGAYFARIRETGRLVTDRQAHPATLYRSGSINSNISRLFEDGPPATLYRQDSVSALTCPKIEAGDIIVETTHFDFVVRPLESTRDYEVIGKSIPFERQPPAAMPRRLWTCHCARTRGPEDHFHTITLRFMATARNMLSYAICLRANVDGDDDTVLRKLSLELPTVGSLVYDTTVEKCVEDCRIKSMDNDCNEHGDASHQDAVKRGHLWFSAHVAGGAPILCTSRLLQVRRGTF